MQDENASVNALNSDAPVVEEVKQESSPDANVQEGQSVDQKEHELPEYAKERLGIQKKRYEKQISNLQRQVEALANAAPRQPEVQQQPAMQIEPGSVQEQVLQTLGMLAQQKDRAENEKRMQQLQEEIRVDAEKYDDFDDVVYAPDVPFTVPIAQATIELPNTADVQYYLGKNKNELNELARLSPIDMRKRLIKLSVDLMNKKAVAQTPKAPKPLDGLKSNPLTKSTSGITAKSTVSEIREFLKKRK